MLKILLAEDTPDLNRALTMILTHEGYFVDSVLDGELALDYLHGDAYDAVILDIMMPKKKWYGGPGRNAVRRQHCPGPPSDSESRSR